MAVTQAQRQARAVAVLNRRNRYQFGQPKAEDVGNAGCADTNIQLIVQISKGRNVSLNKVRERTKAADGAPTTTAQALRGLASFGLRYDAAGGLTAGQVVRTAKAKGPVFICYKYWSGPQWRGYRYLGRTLDGWARNDSGRRKWVGFAWPQRQAGLTQWNFRGGHSGTVVGSVTDDDGTEYAIFRDPNHNSPARPERPAYDLITLKQLNRMLESWGPRSLVLVPRDASNPPGTGESVKPPKPRPKPGPNDDPEDERWLDPDDEDFVLGGVDGATLLTAGVGGAGLFAAILIGGAFVLLAAIGANRMRNAAT